MFAITQIVSSASGKAVERTGRTSKSEQQRDKIHVTQQHNKIGHFSLYISFVGVYKFLKYSGVIANSCICY